MKLGESFLTDPRQIEAWLVSMGVKNYNINEAGLVNVRGDVNLGAKLGKLKSLPVRFCNAGGNFNCDHNQLVSLEGVPNHIGENFFCNNNRLVSLEGAPKEVGKNFYCWGNQLASLEGAPKEVGGDFYCSQNKLVSLEGAPKVVGRDFGCDHNLLVDFRGLEAASIGRYLVVINSAIHGQDNVFLSLDSLPKELHSKVVGLDLKSVLELDEKRTAILILPEAEELSSEVELG